VRFNGLIKLTFDWMMKLTINTYSCAFFFIISPFSLANFKWISFLPISAHLFRIFGVILRFITTFVDLRTFWDFWVARDISIIWGIFNISGFVYSGALRIHREFLYRGNFVIRASIIVFLNRIKYDKKVMGCWKLELVGIGIPVGIGRDYPDFFQSRSRLWPIPIPCRDRDRDRDWPSNPVIPTLKMHS
jgi:hypothetical protein